MHDLPSTWERWSPRILGLLGLILGWLYAGVQNDPNWYTKLSIPAGSGALITLIIGWAWSEYNTNKSAKAMPPPQTNPRTGKPFTREEQAINQAIAEARKNGNTTLVEHLNKSPVTTPVAIGHEEVAR